MNNMDMNNNMQSMMMNMMLQMMNNNNMGGNMQMNNTGGNMYQNMMTNMTQMMKNNCNNMQGDKKNNGEMGIVFMQRSGAKKITLQVNSQDLVSEAISKYKSKSKDNDPSKFIYSGKELSPTLTLAQAGLNNNSQILVISLVDLEGAKLFL